MIKIEGKGGISATIIADSVSSVNGKRITTYELEYHRYIHAEFMTHRMFSRNAASSRAIPVSKMLENVFNSPATPIHWGKNQPGMQANEELTGKELQRAKDWWDFAVSDAVHTASQLNDVGGHKQIVNRLTEPFQMMKVVCTATEYENFFWLRDHEAAQPEIRELAGCMKRALEFSIPTILKPGMWHVPYVNRGFDFSGKMIYTTSDEEVLQEKDILTLEQALKVSSSCCAQVSYRKLDDSLDKAIDIYDKLLASDRKHASPFEHQATPVKEPLLDYFEGCGCEEGVTHVDRTGNVWSGNFQGWIQHRQLIKDHVKW